MTQMQSQHKESPRLKLRPRRFFQTFSNSKVSRMSRILRSLARKMTKMMVTHNVGTKPREATAIPACGTMSPKTIASTRPRGRKCLSTKQCNSKVPPLSAHRLGCVSGAPGTPAPDLKSTKQRNSKAPPLAPHRLVCVSGAPETPRPPQERILLSVYFPDYKIQTYAPLTALPTTQVCGGTRYASYNLISTSLNPQIGAFTELILNT